MQRIEIWFDAIAERRFREATAAMERMALAFERIASSMERHEQTGSRKAQPVFDILQDALGTCPVGEFKER